MPNLVEAEGSRAWTPQWGERITRALAVEYVEADVSGRLVIDAMSPAAYTELLTTPGMAAINRPVMA